MSKDDRIAMMVYGLAVGYYDVPRPSSLFSYHSGEDWPPDWVDADTVAHCNEIAAKIREIVRSEML